MVERRKTVLFIVEGVSDKAALEKIFDRIYKYDRRIVFRVTNGDISSDSSVSVKNVEEKIYDVVHEFMKDKKIKKSDIYQIVQIFDMDGAYIPDNHIYLGDTYSIKYTEEGLYCKDTQMAIKRNADKREIMNYLIGLNEIKDIPYEAYFMSCNLDHALYNVIDLDDDLKTAYADAFYERFIGKEHLFKDFLEKDVANGTPNNKKASWNYIKEELHSVERHTNLHIYFKEHPLPGGML